MEFEGKLAVITGGASGIGRAAARAMAKLGTDIVIADRDDDQLRKESQEIERIGRRVLAIKCDVTQNTDVDNLVIRTISTLGVPDILMNNAGVSVWGNLDKMGITDYELMFDINVLGIIRGVLAFLPHMLEKGSGYIVNTASRAGFYGRIQPYCLAKYALIGYSEGLYFYLHPKGIMVSVLCPGVVNTNLRFNSPIVGDDQEIKDTKLRLADTYSGPDSLQPDEVAEILIAAMKEERFFITTPTTEEHMAEAIKRGRNYQKLESYLQNTGKGQ